MKNIETNEMIQGEIKALLDVSYCFNMRQNTSFSRDIFGYFHGLISEADLSIPF